MAGIKTASLTPFLKHRRDNQLSPDRHAYILDIWVKLLRSVMDQSFLVRITDDYDCVTYMLMNVH